MTEPAKRHEELQEAELFVFMRGSHQTIARMFEQMMTAVTANDRAEMVRLWPQIEAKVRSHLEAEERFVFPAFARAERDEALDLLREHATIRELLLELGIAIELHYLRLDPFQRFAMMLREHADREESLLYRWASERLDAKLASAAIAHANGA